MGDTAEDRFLEGTGAESFRVGICKGQKKLINFLNINFWHPPEKKKTHVPHSLEKNAEKGPASTLLGGILEILLFFPCPQFDIARVHVALTRKTKKVENSPAPYRSLRALRARSAPGSVREIVSKKRGVPESVWRSALGALLKVT